MNEEHAAVKELRLSVRALVKAEIDYASVKDTHFVSPHMIDTCKGIERRLHKASQRYATALDFIEHIIGPNP